MTTYVYDGTYEGFLSAVFRIFADKRQHSAILTAKDKAFGLPFGDEICVEPNDEHADRVEARLKALRISKTVYYAWLYDDEDVHNALVAYIRLAIEQNGKPDGMRYDPAVHAVLTAVRRVLKEVERFQQFTRFVKAGQTAQGVSVYVADIEPAYDILPLLIGFFTGRLGDQCFILRDTVRKYSLVWDTNDWHLSALPEINDAPLPKDGEFEALWKKYFENIAIPWRKNPKLQQHFVPLRYRRYMTEFQD